MTVGQAIKLLVKSGFSLENQKGSHKKYRKGEDVITIVYHSKDSEPVHPKTVKSLNQIIK